MRRAAASYNKSQLTDDCVYISASDVEKHITRLIATRKGARETDEYLGGLTFGTIKARPTSLAPEEILKEIPAG